MLIRIKPTGIQPGKPSTSILHDGNGTGKNFLTQRRKETKTQRNFRFSCFRLILLCPAKILFQHHRDYRYFVVIKTRSRVFPSFVCRMQDLAMTYTPQIIDYLNRLTALLKNVDPAEID